MQLNYHLVDWLTDWWLIYGLYIRSMFFSVWLVQSSSIVLAVSTAIWQEGRRDIRDRDQRIMGETTVRLGSLAITIWLSKYKMHTDLSLGVGGFYPEKLMVHIGSLCQTSAGWMSLQCFTWRAGPLRPFPGPGMSPARPRTRVPPGGRWRIWHPSGSRTSSPRRPAKWKFQARYSTQ